MGASGGPRIINKGLVHYWDGIDKNSYLGSGTVWNDLVGSQHGTLTNFAGTVPYSSFSGSGAIEFEGIGGNSYVDCGSNTYAMGTGDITISTWVNSRVRYGPGWTPNDSRPLANGSTNFIGHIVHTRNLNGASSEDGFYLGMAVDTIFWQLGDGSANNGDFRTAYVESGSWHNIVATRDSASNQFKVYIDGVDSATDTDSLGDIGNSNAFTIGASNYPWDGKISNVRVYNRKLSAAEIKDDYIAFSWRFKKEPNPNTGAVHPV